MTMMTTLYWICVGYAYCYASERTIPRRSPRLSALGRRTLAAVAALLWPAGVMAWLVISVTSAKEADHNGD